MRRWIENRLLAALYALAYQAREALWNVCRPTLIGVRSVVVRGDGACGEVLLVRHRSGGAPWSLPGGAVNQHERLEEAARREVFEEAGVAARVEHLLGVYDAFRGEFTNYVAVFVCMASGDARPPRSLEIAEARFFPFDALPAGLDEGSRRRIEEYLAGRVGVSELW
ncbi:MAG TPA: NUDIX domain-containing protein [Roseiflexaceae bacterium]|nr:NUDIX domain-containing protein [Roseiflexaceae bacterium]